MEKGMEVVYPEPRLFPGVCAIMDDTTGRRSTPVDLLNQWRLFETGAQLWVLQVRLDPLNDLTGGLVRLPGLLRPPGLGVEASQGEVGLPELRRVANGLGQRQGLLQPPCRFVPLAAGQGDLSQKSPAFDHILARVGARSNVQALGGELLRPGRVTTSQPEAPPGWQRGAWSSATSSSRWWPDGAPGGRPRRGTPGPGRGRPVPGRHRRG